MRRTSWTAEALAAIEKEIDGYEWEGDEGYQHRIRDLRNAARVLRACGRSKVEMHECSDGIERAQFVSMDYENEVGKAIIKAREDHK